jgi:hypothetical protein
MPAALDVDWEAVQTLAIAIGVREAARQMGINEDAVRQRSSREGWIKDIPRSQPLPPTMIQPVTNVTTAAKALGNSMREDAQRGRAAALRVSRRALERVDRMEDDQLVVPEVATMAHTWIKGASLAGGYGAADSVARLDLRITTDRTPPVTLDAQWSESTEAVEPVAFEDI